MLHDSSTRKALNMNVCLSTQQQHVLQLMYTCVSQVQELSKALDSATEEIQQLQAELQGHHQDDICRTQAGAVWRQMSAAELRLHVEAC